MQSVNGFFDMLSQFVNGNALYAIVAAAYLLFIYMLRKRERHVAVAALLLLVLLIHNPVSYYILGEKLGYKITYYRFLWIVPYVPLFAYFIYEAIRRITNKKYRMVLVSVVCAGIVCISVKPGELALPDNPYQIPDETIEVAENLQTLLEQDNETSTVILADMYISNTIRQYKAHICLPFDLFGLGQLDSDLKEETSAGLMSMLMYNRNDISQEAIKRIVEENEIEYLVIRRENDVSLTYMQQMNWQIAGSTSSYYILRKV